MIHYIERIILRWKNLVWTWINWLCFSKKTVDNHDFAGKLTTMTPRVIFIPSITTQRHMFCFWFQWKSCSAWRSGRREARGIWLGRSTTTMQHRTRIVSGVSYTKNCRCPTTPTAGNSKLLKAATPRATASSAPSRVAELWPLKEVQSFILLESFSQTFLDKSEQLLVTPILVLDPTQTSKTGTSCDLLLIMQYTGWLTFWHIILETD